MKESLLAILVFVIAFAAYSQSSKIGTFKDYEYYNAYLFEKVQDIMMGELQRPINDNLKSESNGVLIPFTETRTIPFRSWDDVLKYKANLFTDTVANKSQRSKDWFKKEYEMFSQIDFSKRTYFSQYGYCRIFHHTEWISNQVLKLMDVHVKIDEKGKRATVTTTYDFLNYQQEPDTAYINEYGYLGMKLYNTFGVIEKSFSVPKIPDDYEIEYKVVLKSTLPKPEKRKEPCLLPFYYEYNVKKNKPAVSYLSSEHATDPAFVFKAFGFNSVGDIRLRDTNEFKIAPFEKDIRTPFYLHVKLIDEASFSVKQIGVYRNEKEFVLAEGKYAHTNDTDVVCGLLRNESCTDMDTIYFLRVTPIRIGVWKYWDESGKPYMKVDFGKGEDKSGYGYYNSYYLGKYRHLNDKRYTDFEKWSVDSSGMLQNYFTNYGKKERKKDIKEYRRNQAKEYLPYNIFDKIDTTGNYCILDYGGMLNDKRWLTVYEKRKRVYTYCVALEFGEEAFGKSYKSKEAKNFFERLSALGLDTLPSQDDIKENASIMDGVSYNLQARIDGKKIEVNYSNPELQISFGNKSSAYIQFLEALNLINRTVNCDWKRKITDK